MAENYTYTTIEAATTALFKDRGSKFLAYAYPINEENDVKIKLKELKAEHPKAVHHCYAYRIGVEGNRYRTVDDGEPSGSAGKPILGQIDSACLTNVVVIVVRYFGGTLLGVPGLINAYKTATVEALNLAVKKERWIEKRVDLSFDYNVLNEVKYLLQQSESTIYKQDLHLFCNIIAGIPLKYLLITESKLSQLRGLTLKEVEMNPQ